MSKKKTQNQSATPSSSDNTATLEEINTKIGLLQKARRGQKVEWEKVRFQLVLDGYKRQEIDSQKKDYVTDDLRDEIKKLRARKYYYEGAREYQKQYKQRKREAVKAATNPKKQ